MCIIKVSVYISLLNFLLYQFTFPQCKKKCQEQNSTLNAETMKLIYKGKILKNPDTLKSVGVEDGHMLHIVKGAGGKKFFFLYCNCFYMISSFIVILVITNGGFIRLVLTFFLINLNFEYSLKLFLSRCRPRSCCY